MFTCSLIFPSGILQVIYAQRIGRSSDLMQTLSLIMSWGQCFAKFSKILFLKDLIPARTKQAQKVRKLEALLAGREQRPDPTIQKHSGCTHAVRVATGCIKGALKAAE